MRVSGALLILLLQKSDNVVLTTLVTNAFIFTLERSRSAVGAKLFIKPVYSFMNNQRRLQYERVTIVCATLIKQTHFNERLNVANTYKGNINDFFPYRRREQCTWCALFVRWSEERSFFEESLWYWRRVSLNWPFLLAHLWELSLLHRDTSRSIQFHLCALSRCLF